MSRVPRERAIRAVRGATSERGVALVLGLIVLLSLTGLVLAFLAMSAFEPQISQNLVDTINARMLADSGIEAAYNTLVTTPSWNTVLAAATAATCASGAPGILLGAPGAPLPGLSTVSGTVTVRIRNDCQPADATLTGVLPEASNFASDLNHRLVVEATGRKNTATRTISAVIRRITVPGLNGALAFPGVQGVVTASGASLLLDGRDTRLTDTPGAPTGTGAPVLGVSTSTAASATLVQAGLAGNASDVHGRDPSGAGAVQGLAAIASDAGLTSQMVADFVTAVQRVADVTIPSSSARPAVFRDVGATCGSSVSDSRCWGTDAHPRIVHVKATLATPDEQFTALDISGASAGAGILIVENGHLDIAGDFAWHGPVIVTGNNVGIHFRGDGRRLIVGGTIVNELHTSGAPNLVADAQGSSQVVYSREAMDLITTSLARRLTTIYSWREK